jgi:hypothetical protein
VAGIQQCEDRRLGGPAYRFVVPRAACWNRVAPTLLSKIPDYKDVAQACVTGGEREHPPLEAGFPLQVRHRPAVAGGEVPQRGVDQVSSLHLFKMTD